MDIVLHILYSHAVLVERCIIPTHVGALSTGKKGNLYVVQES